ncbi:MAG: hypothetical protein IIA45_09670 [Bacteroidetes bacterium]|nr:hypothetical protein [Bacteroidota bacterium]
MTFYREFLKFSGRFLILFLVIFSLNLKMDVTAGPGDTTIVQAFTFGSPQNDWFLFPPDSIRFEKILMYYTLKCHPPPGVGNPAFPCGEWDYLTYSYLYEHTGKMDSNVLSHANYEENGASHDAF